MLALILLVPTVTLFVECVAALWPRKAAESGADVQAPRTTILIPAHNEAAIIAQTIAQLQASLPAATDILLVADNCNDETGAIARRLGTAVVERADPNHLGKGYALHFGIVAMTAEPPDVVIVLDADCQIDRPSIERLAAEARRQDRPVQATYLLRPPPDAAPNDLLSAFAFIVKNQVRPLGLNRLGQPCLLTGSGMAFPWHSLASKSLATDNIVEDMQMGLEMALDGRAPRFCPEALVTGDLPNRQSDAFQQRTRWEHGHIQTTVTQVPRLLMTAMTRRDGGLLALALEQSVPPLALLVLLWVTTAVMSAVDVWLNGPGPGFLLTVLGGGLLLTAVAVAWLGYGRQVLPGHVLMRVPGYVLWKIPLYVNYIVRRQTAWIRTERE